MLIDTATPRRLLPHEQAAEYLTESVRGLRNKVAAGDIPVVQIGKRRIAYDIQDLDAYIDSHKVLRGEACHA